MLIDGGNGNFEKMIDIAKSKRKKTFFTNTKACDESREYEQLLGNINRFSKSTSEIMLAKFSGRESIVTDLGDESPEMIVSLSYNKNSNYYTENPVDMFLDLINIFERGD